MKALCVGIYGETCAGKSTLGKHLESAMNCSYISFGDLKRQEIIVGTEVGLVVKNLLELECPLPAEFGYAVIRNQIKNGLNIISGYPISLDEFNLLSSHAAIIGILSLNIDERILIQRFAVRRECPKCYEPGIIGDVCSVHKILMVQREGLGLDELINRRKLYRRRIAPFLELKQISVLPRLSIESGILTKKETITKTESWIRQLLIKNGGG